MSFFCISGYPHPGSAADAEQDSGDITIEGQIIGEKAFYDCPIRLSFYGPSNPAERTRVENALKADKFIKATQLKQTKKDAEARRVVLGLTNGSSTAGGLGSSQQPLAPEVSLEDILKSSDAIEFRKGNDAIKTLAMGEEQLSKMPQAEQPKQLKSTLLPYQLQVCPHDEQSCFLRGGSKLMFTNRDWRGCNRKRNRNFHPLGQLR